MLLTPDYQCYLTQAGEVAASEREFFNEVYLNDSSEAAQYRQIDREEYERLKQQKDVLLFTPTADYYGQLSTALSVAKQKVNETAMTEAQALDAKQFYPIWGEEGAEIGKAVGVGFRLREIVDGQDILYEVIQAHTLQADWKPSEVKSLYKVVEITHAGTLDDPIPWKQGMVVETGRYYTDQGVTYQGIRDSVNPMAFNLIDLVSAGYVKTVEQ